jgi:nicotinamidase-related amidase
MSAPSREVPIDPAHAALLIIDVQNYGVRAEVACDLGYLVTLVTDACTTTSADRHEQSLIGIRGYCRQRTTDAVVAEITALTGFC